MIRKIKTPRYALRLVTLIVLAVVVFFGGLRLFVPEGSKLTGTYDAKSLLYIAAAPVAYRGEQSCGTVNCHESVYWKWKEGAHGSNGVQSKCEVCHGPQGDHPAIVKKLPKVRGDGDIVGLCLNCHQRLRARSSTGQPQITPQEHPYPHQGKLLCTQCHDPHSPRLGKPTKSTDKTDDRAARQARVPQSAGIEALAAQCVACHGASGRGGFAPALAEQPRKKLMDALLKFKSGKLTSAMMNPIAAKLDDNDIVLLANYFGKK